MLLPVLVSFYVDCTLSKSFCRTLVKWLHRSVYMKPMGYTDSAQILRDPTGAISLLTGTHQVQKCYYLFWCPFILIVYSPSHFVEPSLIGYTCALYMDPVGYMGST